MNELTFSTSSHREMWLLRKGLEKLQPSSPGEQAWIKELQIKLQTCQEEIERYWKEKSVC